MAQKRLSEYLTTEQRKTVRSDHFFDVVSNRGNVWRIHTRTTVSNIQLVHIKNQRSQPKLFTRVGRRKLTRRIIYEGSTMCVVPSCGHVYGRGGIMRVREMVQIGQLLGLMYDEELLLSQAF